MLLQLGSGAVQPLAKATFQNVDISDSHDKNEHKMDDGINKEVIKDEGSDE